MFLQVGAFPHYGGRWAEWNGRFRDTVRAFVKGTEGPWARAFANALAGSPDMYGASQARTWSCYQISCVYCVRLRRELQGAGFHVICQHIGCCVALRPQGCCPGRMNSTCRQERKGDWWGSAAGAQWRGGRGPSASINFITAHDGFTLADLVSYNTKHNEANGEDNRCASPCSTWAMQ